MLRWIPLILMLALCSGCAAMTAQSEARALDTTLVAYANALRWGGWEQALVFVDPETRKQHPLSDLDLERYKQVRIASYTERPPVPAGPHEVRQVVQIGLININTQTERGIVDDQLWRYDEKTKHWYLMSGLPDITHH
ncbi:MAG TPA: hypothetical protein VFN13_08215 [Rudaea sp.]|nr:hypothetical protein [Rudaea sp.]